MLFVYGRILSPRLVNTVTWDEVGYQLVSKIIKYHMAVCYFLYIAGALFRLVDREIVLNFFSFPEPALMILSGSKNSPCFCCLDEFDFSYLIVVNG